MRLFARGCECSVEMHGMRNEVRFVEFDPQMTARIAIPHLLLSARQHSSSDRWMPCSGVQLQESTTTVVRLPAT